MSSSVKSVVRWGTGGALVTALACVPTGTPPPASFLVIAGDSTYWVERAGDRLRVRASPLFLGRLRGEFFELYIADDDRSYHDALIVGQRIYRRNLATGDSTLLREDTTIAAVATSWAVAHPGDAPLEPDEDIADEPATVATTETQLLDVVGPYLSFEYHLDIDVDGIKQQHLTRRGVIDVRSGRPVRIEDLAGTMAAGRIYADGIRAMQTAIDSIRSDRDERAARARSTIGGFRFDSTSFELLESEWGPQVAFLVPGRGPTAGGFALPLPPAPLPERPWWEDLRGTHPVLQEDRLLRWSADGYDVVARRDSLGDVAQLSLERGRRSWQVGTFPEPIRRVHRLDAPRDSLARQALARAFDDAAGYSGDARTVALPHGHGAYTAADSHRLRSRSPARGADRSSDIRLLPAWNPKPRVTPKRS